MPSRSTFALYDRLLDGQLASYIRAWRSVDPPMSYDLIASELLGMTGEPVNGETVRRWCIEQGIAA